MSQTEEFDDKRKFWLKPLIITSMLIDRSLVQTEAEPICYFQ